MAANSSNDDPLGTGMCGRPPGAISTYRAKIGALALDGTSTSRTDRRRRRRKTAWPSAARTLATQLHSPSIDTRYQWPSTSAMPRGNDVVLPDTRPGTSKVTHRLDKSPAPKTRPQNLANQRASAFPRPPEYMSRARSLEIGQRGISGGRHFCRAGASPSRVETRPQTHCPSRHAPSIGRKVLDLGKSSIGQGTCGWTTQSAWRNADRSVRAQPSTPEFRITWSTGRRMLYGILGPVPKRTMSCACSPSRSSHRSNSGLSVATSMG